MLNVNFWRTVLWIWIFFEYKFCYPSSYYQFNGEDQVVLKKCTGSVSNVSSPAITYPPFGNPTVKKGNVDQCQFRKETGKRWSPCYVLHAYIDSRKCNYITAALPFSSFTGQKWWFFVHAMYNIELYPLRISLSPLNQRIEIPPEKIDFSSLDDTAHSLDKVDWASCQFHALTPSHLKCNRQICFAFKKIHYFRKYRVLTNKYN